MKEDVVPIKEAPRQDRGGDSPGPNARERLIESFWGMMARMPFDDITIGGISREANVSQDTLYYHFDGLLGIAHEAVEAELSEETAERCSVVLQMAGFRFFFWKAPVTAYVYRA